MIEKVCTPIEVLTLNSNTDISYAVDAFLCGKIAIFRVGSVFSIMFDPRVEGLVEKVNLLKGRHTEQFYSLVCTYDQAKGLVDKNRVNEDFFRLSPQFCGKVIIRFPVDTTISHQFQYNTIKGTLQFISFEDTNPLRASFQEEVAARGCKYIYITSANFHAAPTIGDLDEAKSLAAVFNAKSSSYGFQNVQTIVFDIPTDRVYHKGSYAILCFSNPNAIEVKRLTNKTDKEATEKHLTELFTTVHTQTPLIYSV